MRPELKKIEIIERYLNNEFSETEKLEFEKRLAKDSQLKAEVEIQRELELGIKRAGLRQAVQKAYVRYRLGKNAWKWGLGGGGIVIAAFLALPYLNSEEFAFLENLQQTEKKLVADADLYIPSQNFKLKADSDTVVEGQEGLVLAIPANAFVDEKGNPVRGEIDLEVKEAINPSSIISGGLSTVSDGKTLETGGMFYLNAQKDGRSLKIKEGMEIFADVPTEEIQAGMQLYSGERKKDGSLNWVNPKPLPNLLVPVDIHSLDFYPPNYLDSLSSWGLKAEDKEYRDSLFYSIYCGSYDPEPVEVSKPSFTPTSSAITQELRDTAILSVDTPLGTGYVIVKKAVPRNLNRILDLPDSTAAEENDSTVAESVSVHGCKGLKPSAVQAIWNDKFQNTNLATHEFEERIKLLYQTCKSDLLDLYTANLDRPLFMIDSMICNRVKETAVANRWKEFYSRKDGQVNLDSRQAQMLSAYYRQKRSVYKKAAQKASKKFWDKQSKLDGAAKQKSSDFNKKDSKRMQKNYQKELDLNLDEAYRQLGKRRPPYNANTSRYTAAVTNLGWKNIDRVAAEATASRSNLNFEDKDGRKAQINYDSLAVKVEQKENLDRTYVYLISEDQYSFLRIKEVDGVYRTTLNELMSYKIMVVAYSGEQAHFGIIQRAKPQEYEIALKALDSKDLNIQIQNHCKRRTKKDIRKDIEYQNYKANDDERRESNRKARALTNKLYRLVFPCSEIQVEYSSSTQSSVSNVEMIIQSKVVEIQAPVNSNSVSDADDN